MNAKRRMFWAPMQLVAILCLVGASTALGALDPVDQLHQDIANLNEQLADIEDGVRTVDAEITREFAHLDEIHDAMRDKSRPRREVERMFREADAAIQKLDRKNTSLADRLVPLHDRINEYFALASELGATDAMAAVQAASNYWTVLWDRTVAYAEDCQTLQRTMDQMHREFDAGPSIGG